MPDCKDLAPTNVCSLLVFVSMMMVKRAFDPRGEGRGGRGRLGTGAYFRAIFYPKLANTGHNSGFPFRKSSQWIQM